MSKLGYSGAGATSGLSNTLKKDKFQVNRSCGAMDNASDYEIAGSYPAAARNANIFIALFTNYMIEYYLDFYLFLLGAACLFVSYSGVLIALNVHCSICNRKTSKLEPLYSEPEPHNRFRSVVPCIKRSCGAMDNASDYGSEDCRFESCQDRNLFSMIENFYFLFFTFCKVNSHQIVHPVNFKKLVI